MCVYFGCCYGWVNNESENTRVWFDDVKVTQMQALVTQATDYGVWGDVLREQKAKLDTTYLYKYAYQGNFAERDKETGWNHFELREYDAALGRWTSVDPKRIGWSPYIGMYNNPVSGTDPDGGGPGGGRDMDGEYTGAKQQMKFNGYDRLEGSWTTALDEVILTPDLVDNFVDGMWWINPVESVDIYIGGAIKTEIHVGPTKTVVPMAGVQLLANTNTGFKPNFVTADQAYGSLQVGSWDLRGAPLVGIGGDYDPSFRALYTVHQGLIPDAPILQYKIQADGTANPFSNKYSFGARGVVSPTLSFPTFGQKKSGITGEINTGIRFNFKTPEIVRVC